MGGVGLRRPFAIRPAKLKTLEKGPFSAKLRTFGEASDFFRP
jgi:hypothetical protein